MKKAILALSLVFFLSAGIITASKIQYGKASLTETAFVMANDDASVFAYTDGDDEKDKKKKAKEGDAKKDGKKCCSETKSGSSDAKCATSSKKCCDTKKSCDKDKK